MSWKAPDSNPDFADALGAHLQAQAETEAVERELRAKYRERTETRAELDRVSAGGGGDIARATRLRQRLRAIEGELNEMEKRFDESSTDETLARLREAAAKAFPGPAESTRKRIAPRRQKIRKLAAELADLVAADRADTSRLAAYYGPKRLRALRLPIAPMAGVRPLPGGVGSVLDRLAEFDGVGELEAEPPQRHPEAWTCPWCGTTYNRESQAIAIANHVARMHGQVPTEEVIAANHEGPPPARRDLVPTGGA